MKTRQRSTLIGLVLCLALTMGCIHKTGAVTPWETVTTENAVLAQSLDTATQGVIAVQASGLITAQQAMPVLQWMSQAAVIQQQLNAILAQAPTAANIPAIQALVTQLGTSAAALVSSGALGVKNPKSQQTIGADVRAIVGAAQTILAAYQNAIGGAQ